MGKKLVKIIVAIFLLAIIGIIAFAYMHRSVLCTGITMCKNSKDNSMMEYNGYYVKDARLSEVLQNNKEDIEKICRGKFKEAYTSRAMNSQYIIFSEDGNKSAIVINNENGEIMVCEQVKYSITYEIGSKGDCEFFGYNKETAIIY